MKLKGSGLGRRREGFICMRCATARHMICPALVKFLKAGGKGLKDRSIAPIDRGGMEGGES